MSDLPAWEAWLEERFAAYLLRAAAVERRGGVDVARALSRLSGSPNALADLAAISFLLDPAHDMTRLVGTLIPRHLEHVAPAMIRDDETARGRMRGRIAWSRTLALRQRTRDPILFATSVARRTYAAPELPLLRWLLGRVLEHIETVHALAGLGDRRAEREGWSGTLAELHQGATECLRHAALREVPDRRPSLNERRLCQFSRLEALRAAAAAVARHDLLLPRPHGDVLKDSLSRFALAPVAVERRFELFTLLAVMEAVDRSWPAASRVDTLISSRRKAIAVWTDDQWRLRLIYDQRSPSGQYSDLLEHYLDLRAVLRPDVRLVLQGPEHRVELYIDAKLSERPQYLRGSLHKMISYVVDRPGAFLPHGPRGVLVSLLPAVRPPRPDDAVVFVDPAGCRPGGPLDEVIRCWLSGAGAARPSA